MQIKEHNPAQFDAIVEMEKFFLHRGVAGGIQRVNDSATRTRQTANEVLSVTLQLSRPPGGQKFEIEGFINKIVPHNNQRTPQAGYSEVTQK